MPWRTCSVRTRASSLVSQPSSSHGSNVKSRFQRTRYSLHWRATFDISTPSKVRGSRHPLTFIATRSTPPRLGSSALAVEGARPPSARAPAALTPNAAIVARYSRRFIRPLRKPSATGSAWGCRGLSVNISLVIESLLVAACGSPIRQGMEPPRQLRQKDDSSGIAREMFAFPQFLCGVPRQPVLQCLFLTRILNLDDVRASCRMGRIERMRFAATDRRRVADANSLRRATLIQNGRWQSQR